MIHQEANERLEKPEAVAVVAYAVKLDIEGLDHCRAIDLIEHFEEKGNEPNQSDA